MILVLELVEKGRNAKMPWERYTFYETEFMPEEIKKIEKVKIRVRLANLELPPYFTDSDILRHIQSQQYHTKLVLQVFL